MEYQLMDITMPEDPTVFDVEEFWGRLASTKNKVRNVLHTQHDLLIIIAIKGKCLSNRGLWFLFSKVTGLNKFGRLSKIAALVLVLPHSNADAERVFSMVGLNKTSTRNSLVLDGTLSSIMTLKMAGLEPNCFKWEPKSTMIRVQKGNKHLQ